MPYTFDNVEWVTWQQNIDRAHRDMRLGELRTAMPLKPVVSINKATGECVEYLSVSDAARVTGVLRPNIASVCSGKVLKNGISVDGQQKYRKLSSAGGYYWKFKNEK